MAFDLPRVIGHRGAAAYAPENTLEGLREAARRGAGWVEFDAKLTGDGVVVLMHDDTLDRTTDGTGPVAETSYAEISHLDAGAWFGPAWRGARVPTLADALALLVELDLQA
ncbi:MAG TPA: glycerophosphodiester phosphodiesterase family protein, partial [Dongiaceae bacterium]|nr:glycerophosphodiester phosphodiesterase family protein [Dongiaceae bacterium]